MRIGILGDIHSNLEALDAVLAAAADEGIDHWVQVGDIVGYGADPVPCVDRVRELGCTVCMGNHDAAVVGYLATDYFNHYAREAIEWTRNHLDDERLDWLRGLELVVEHEHYQLVHGSLFLPDRFGYVLGPAEAVSSMERQTKAMTFVGHSHVPALYVQRSLGDPEKLQVLFESEFQASVAGIPKSLLNVGSVGQPRDEDPRAAYGVYDTDTRIAAVRRVEYDVATTQRKIRAAGLPSVLADRLQLGV